MVRVTTAKWNLKDRFKVDASWERRRWALGRCYFLKSVTEIDNNERRGGFRSKSILRLSLHWELEGIPHPIEHTTWQNHEIHTRANTTYCSHVIFLPDSRA